MKIPAPKANQCALGAALRALFLLVNENPAPEANQCALGAAPEASQCALGTAPEASQCALGAKDSLLDLRTVTLSFFKEVFL